MQTPVPYALALGALVAFVAFGSGCGTGFRPLGVDGGAPGDADPGLVPLAELDLPDGAVVRAVSGTAANDVHIVGDDGLIRDYDGTTWFAASAGGGRDLTGVWGTGPDDVYAVGTDRSRGTGYVMHREPLASGQLNWIILTDKTRPLRAMWGAGDLRVACGRSGVVYQGPNSDPFVMGLQFNPAPGIMTDFAPILYSVSGNSPPAVMIAADVQTTLFYDGAMWHTYVDPSDPTRAFHAIFGLPGPDLGLWEGANYYGLHYFTGRANPVTQYNDEKEVAGNVNRSIWGIWSDAADRVVAVGDGGRIMTFRVGDPGVVVRRAPTDRNLYGVWGSSFDDLYIVGEGPTVLHGAIHF
jgi:hypothetical protein